MVLWANPPWIFCQVGYVVVVLQKAAEASDYINEQNKNIYRPKGLLIVDPMLRGLRVLEFILINTDATTLTV